MSYILYHFKVEDYARWKSVFDEDPLDRGSSGSKGGFVFRNASDPTEVMVLLEWEQDKLERLRQFNESPKMEDVRERSGYTGTPDVYVLEVDDRPSV